MKQGNEKTKPVYEFTSPAVLRKAAHIFRVLSWHPQATTLAQLPMSALVLIECADIVSVCQSATTQAKPKKKAAK